MGGLGIQARLIRRPLEIVISHGLGVTGEAVGRPSGSAVKTACNAGATKDMGSIPGSGRAPACQISGGGSSYPLQHSCLGNPMGRGAWRATVRGVAESGTQLSEHEHRQESPEEQETEGEETWKEVWETQRRVACWRDPRGRPLSWALGGFPGLGGRLVEALGFPILGWGEWSVRHPDVLIIKAPFLLMLSL